MSLVNQDEDFSYLGVAMENQNWFSRLLFSWVNPLMEKGDNEMLKDSEDLFDLPTDMHVGSITHKIEEHIYSSTAVKSSTDLPPG